MCFTSRVENNVGTIKSFVAELIVAMPLNKLQTAFSLNVGDMGLCTSFLSIISWEWFTFSQQMITWRSQRVGVATATSELWCCLFAVWKPPQPQYASWYYCFTYDYSYLVVSVVVTPLCMLVSLYFSVFAIPVRTQESWKHDAPGFFSAGSHGTTRLRQWWGA